MSSLLQRLWRDKRSQLLLARYLAIGGFVFCIDVGSFKLLLSAGLFRPLATVCSYAIAVTVHFTCNRVFNFRSFERTIVQQARTYLIIVSLLAVFTVGIVEFAVRLGIDPVLAKVIAIACNVPAGFLAHRYLTFGAGIGATYRRLRAAGASSERTP